MVSRSSGFTLLEMLAVLLLIGLMAGSATIYIGGESQKSKTEKAAEKFIQLAEHMRDISVLSGEAVGLVLVPPPWSEKRQDEPAWGYQWRRFIELEDDQGNYSASWEPVDGVELEEVPSEIEFLVQLEGENWDWNSGPKVETPVFVVYPSGEAEPLLFHLEFLHSDLEVPSQNFQLDQYGHLVWVEVTQDFEALEDRF